MPRQHHGLRALFAHQLVAGREEQRPLFLGSFTRDRHGYVGAMHSVALVAGR